MTIKMAKHKWLTPCEAHLVASTILNLDSTFI
ncbi:MAG: hypothetical protein ACJAU0_001379 [Flavobacteriales bacterium]|jgi:hypothetical protein